MAVRTPSQAFDAALEAVNEIANNHQLMGFTRRSLLTQIAEVVDEELTKLDNTPEI